VTVGLFQNRYNSDLTPNGVRHRFGRSGGLVLQASRLRLRAAVVRDSIRKVESSSWRSSVRMFATERV